MDNIKELILSAIEQSRGDDLCRAKRAFKGFTPEQMQEEHSCSGKTRQQILDGFRLHNSRCDVAIDIIHQKL